VLELYAREGRILPWRSTREPWSILVSEVMLQQTQVARVEPKYLAFLRGFPSAAALAAAPLEDVYAAWKGLGYNSRALRLRETARICNELHGGLPPRTERELLALPGIGRYTARAVLAFAYDIPSAFLETNIRAALLFHFFPGRERVSDRELEAAAVAVLDREDPRTWYYALMDYGAFIKRREPNPARRAAAYARQGRFEGSLRQARGAVLRALEARSRVGSTAGLESIAAEAGLPYGRIEEAVRALIKDGLVREADGSYRFAD